MLPPKTLVFAWLLGFPAVASAQNAFESVGIRAMGMAGAFVGVADDSTAVYWNPAGLATGVMAGMTIGSTRLHSGKQNGKPAPGPWSQSSSLTSVGFLPLGAFYGRIQTTRLVAGPDGKTLAESFQATQVGVAVLQSLAKGVVLGSTLKYVRGSAGTSLATGATVGDALEQGAAQPRRGSGAFDFDVGLMIDMERVRLGLTSRNLREPSFLDDAGNAFTLKRQSRLGIAALPSDGLTLAMDVDLDTVDLRGDLRRMIAFGGESRLGARLALRGGVRWNLKGQDGFSRAIAATGVSLRVRKALWLDGFYTHGRLDGDRGFGIGLRAGG